MKTENIKIVCALWKRFVIIYYFKVCAPRLIRDLSNDNLLHGLCYWSANTTGSSPVDVKKLAPFKEKGLLFPYI